MYHFVMPPDGLNHRQVDELFRPQAENLQRRGYQVSLVPDSAFRDGSTLRQVPAGAIVVYRGWMIRPDEYTRFETATRNAGATLFTNSNAYALTHHLPNWYSVLSEFTPETISIRSADDLKATLKNLDWEAYFLKDFVKSLKVGGGSIVRTNEEADRWVSEMLNYRDELEGGICIRRVESYMADSECRFFVLNGAPYAPDNRSIPTPVAIAAQKIASPFFTVDIAYTTTGQCRIVELGDGQVSDLVGWTATQFAEIWPTEAHPASET
jgi:hypothetical protein